VHVRAAKRAQRQAERSRAFAFAVAGIDDQQAAPLTLGLLIRFVCGGGASICIF
jgi:hypothetical protein